MKCVLCEVLGFMMCHVELTMLAIPSLGHLRTFEGVYLLIRTFSVKMLLSDQKLGFIFAY